MDIEYSKNITAYGFIPENLTNLEFYDLFTNNSIKNNKNKGIEKISTETEIFADNSSTARFQVSNFDDKLLPSNMTNLYFLE